MRFKFKAFFKYLSPNILEEKNMVGGTNGGIDEVAAAPNA